MKTELEVKILDINVSNILKKLQEIWAKKIVDRNMRRYVYDIPERANSWVRLRDDWTKITLTIKEIVSDYIDGTKEIEVEVNDFEATNTILKKLGYNFKSYQENKRTSFKLWNTCIEVDSWPKIPPYLEIEADSEEEIEETVKLLGYKTEDTTSVSVNKVYASYSLNIDDYRELKF